MDNAAALNDLQKLEGILEKHLGVGVFASDEIRPIPRITTGFAVIDYILGGGLPRGMITEIFGPESTGKSTFCAQVAAANQKLDPNFRILYLDFEQTMTKDYLRNLGLDTNRPRLLFSQPSTIEEGALISKVLLQRGLVDMIIWDTPAASQPASMVNEPLTEKELREGYRDIDRGQSNTGAIGLHARCFSHAIAALVPLVAEKNAVMLFPNQIRTQIQAYGAGETTPGGRALKFYAAVRIRLSKKQTVKESVSDSFFGTKQATAVQNNVQFHSVKNKTAPPFRLCEVKLRYGRGFLDRETLFDLAVKRKIVDKAGGGNFSLPGGKRIRGTEAVLQFWEENPEEYLKVVAALRDSVPSTDEYEEVSDTETEGASLIEDEVEEDTSSIPEGKVSI